MMRNPEQLFAEKWQRFGRWVFEKRTQRGWTQEFCAERAGMKRQQWGRIEKGASTKEVTVMRVADALEADRDEALKIINSQPPGISGARPSPDEVEEAILTLLQRKKDDQGLSDETKERLRKILSEG